MNSFFSFAEAHLILYKDNESREQNEMNSFFSFAEAHLILYKLIIKYYHQIFNTYFFQHILMTEKCVEIVLAHNNAADNLPDAVNMM